MIVQRVRIYPAFGKEAEVRDFMTEWVKSAQGQGERLGLAQRIFSSEGPALIVPRWFSDVAAADARRRENAVDSDWQGRLAKLSGMIREPVRQTIEDIVVAPVASGEPIGTVRRVFFYPALDKAGELRSRLTEFVEGVNAAGGTGVSLSQQIFSETGPLLVITTTHKDVAALDQVRQARAEEAQALVSSVAPLSRAPIAVRLLQVIVAPQS